MVCREFYNNQTEAVAEIKFCSLYSGSSGNALFLCGGNTRILIDAGLSAKRIITALHSIDENPSNLNAIVISHEHADHIRGAGILSRKLGIPIYANVKTWEAMGPAIGTVKPENRQLFPANTRFIIGDITVQPFAIPHDAVEPTGFSFFYQQQKVTVATDIGHINEELLRNLQHSDLILLESNHDLQMLQNGSYPYYLKRRILSDHGHLSNEAAGEVAVQLAASGTVRFILGHLSKENNLPELAYQTVLNALLKQGFQPGTDITLSVALRDQVGQVVNL